jgi:hypothetical protein
VIRTQLSNDNELMLELYVAEKLGYTLGEMRERMVPEELYLWSAFYEHKHLEEEKAYKKASKGRR